MKDFIHNAIANISSTLARNLKDTYASELESYNGNMIPILKQGFGLSIQDTYDFLSKGENLIYEICERELKAVFRGQTNQQLLRMFNEKFKKDEAGKARNWPEVEEAKIKELYD